MAHTIMPLHVQLQVVLTVECRVEPDPDTPGAVQISASDPVFKLQDPTELVKGSERVAGREPTRDHKNPYPPGSPNHSLYEAAREANVAAQNQRIAQETLNKAQEGYGGRFGEERPKLTPEDEHSVLCGCADCVATWGPLDSSQTKEGNR